MPEMFLRKLRRFFIQLGFEKEYAVSLSQRGKDPVAFVRCEILPYLIFSPPPNLVPRFNIPSKVPFKFRRPVRAEVTSQWRPRSETCSQRPIPSESVSCFYALRSRVGLHCCSLNLPLVCIVIGEVEGGRMRRRRKGVVLREIHAGRLKGGSFDMFIFQISQSEKGGVPVSLPCWNFQYGSFSSWFCFPCIRYPNFK